MNEDYRFSNGTINIHTLCVIVFLFVDRITDIYEWIFEVNEEVSGDDRGRINLVVEYEMNVHQKEMYRSVENRIVARVEIQRDNVFAIVPVIKVCVALLKVISVIRYKLKGNKGRTRLCWIDDINEDMTSLGSILKGEMTIDQGQRTLRHLL